MTAAQSLKIYEILTKHFGDTADATAVVTEIEQIVESKIIDKTVHLATKQDLSEAKVDIIKWMASIFLALSLMVLGLYVKK